MRCEEIDKAADELSRATKNAKGVRLYPNEYTPATVEAVRKAWPILWRLDKFAADVLEMRKASEDGKPYDKERYDVQQVALLRILETFACKQYFGLHHFVNIRRVNKRKQK